MTDESMIQEAILKAIDERAAQIVNAKADEARKIITAKAEEARLEIREMVGQIASRACSEISYERFGNQLRIIVNFNTKGNTQQ